MRILIAGASGLIGSTLAPFLTMHGHEVARLVRREPGPGEVRWDPDGGAIDAAGLQGFDAVVHMASLPQARCTPDYLQRLRANRLGTNRLLASALADCVHGPRVLVCASGQGFYAPAEEAVLTEISLPGNDFLAGLQRDGEAATEPACRAGIRVVHLRLPSVLGGAALAAFAPIICRFGSGRQWFSWVARDELPRIVQHVLVMGDLAGPVNAASPGPVRNADFCAALARVLGRRPWLPMPAVALRLMLGQMAEALLLASRRLAPARLLQTGYQFCLPDLEGALRHELGMLGRAAPLLT